MSADNSFLAGLLGFTTDLFSLVAFEIALTNELNVPQLPLYAVSLDPPPSVLTSTVQDWPTTSVVQALVNLTPVTAGPVSVSAVFNGFVLYAKPTGKAKVGIAETRFQTPVGLPAGGSLVLPVGGIVLSLVGFDVDG